METPKEEIETSYHRTIERLSNDKRLEKIYDEDNFKVFKFPECRVLIPKPFYYKL